MRHESDQAGAPGQAESELERLRLQLAQQSLVQALERWAVEGEVHRPAVLPGLTMFRSAQCTQPTCAVYEPSLCLVVQGRKRVAMGNQTLVYGSRDFLVTSLNLPTLVQIEQASPDKPYLALALSLDLREINRLLLEGQLPQAPAGAGGHAMAVGRLRWPLLRAVQRLVELLDEPQSIPVVAPLVQREILYWLLASDLGPRLQQTLSVGTQGHQISRAVDWLRVHFAEPLRIDDLAAEVRMSASTFHRHFKALTAMSPLQYQKRLRLAEARRLMFADHLDASTAAFRVGYESVSQFSREYSREFGAPPMRDIAGLRSAAPEAATSA
jgi:AraC-like DNA-binding protein